ncbi:MAG TPA: dihydrodipicolinate synthase family protein [Acidobacteriota bacterium]
MRPEKLIPTPKAFPIENCLNRIAPHRKIEGICAVLLPFDQKGTPDFPNFARLVDFTARSGLTPAVNMDTGYVHLLSQQDRAEVLKITRQVMSGRRFVAGAFIEGRGGPIVDLYLGQVDSICSHGGTPILFQCSALKGKSTDEIAAVYQAVASRCDGLLAFELGEMFAPFGQIYSLEAVDRLMRIPQILGMKHSSLDRRLEWERLELRDRLRPDFKIYTGNDLAIDMVMYGSDYLLGLAAFAPDAFTRRDNHWAKGEAEFFAFNDLLQYLGSFAFRDPVPAYRHSAAQFLKLRGLIPCDQPHPQSPRRPSTDLEILQNIAQRLDRLMET